MSLLGTWHGGDEASKWNPATSSLFQILLSVQGMVFVEVGSSSRSRSHMMLSRLKALSCMSCSYCLPVDMEQHRASVPLLPTASYLLQQGTQSAGVSRRVSMAQ